MPVMRILICGSSGHLGSTIAAILAKDHTVVGLDRLPGKYTTDLGSVTDRGLIQSLLDGIDAVIHTASLHARHLNEYASSEFVDTNVQGILNLLEAAVEKNVQRFVYTSTTSLYGLAMVPSESAVWVTEGLEPIPRDIYDSTKIAAENLCKMIANNHGLPCISLRVSRFFPEPENLLAIYRLYRGVDVRDAALAHVLTLGADLESFKVFNISARSPFSQDDVHDLYHDAAGVIKQHFPGVEGEFAKKGWELPGSIDRVYVINKAEKELGYEPQYNFQEYLDAIKK